ncbi:MAG: hypothetical protein HY657_18100 [Acidobacteria bacterium]|nr:hypothetical protein [Acidobacteriota bacterium]
MITRLAVRSLAAHPVRTAVLAAGFGVGVAVMAILLGVAEIVLEQSRAPALAGGGDVVIRLSPQVPARLVLAGTLQADALRPRVAAASPSHRAALYLTHQGRSTRVAARGGIPSLEQAIGDDETAAVAAWRDGPDDVAWVQDTPDRVLRQIDRFHAVPTDTEWSSSWAEWLYFNGRAAAGRLYLTFLVGPVLEGPSTALRAGPSTALRAGPSTALGAGLRAADVRLQLDRGGEVESFGERVSISEADVQRAPDLTIGASSVRLDGLQYRIHLDLPGENGRRVRGDLVLDASPGRLVPPIEIAGARGWRTGYVVPVMDGALHGTLTVDDEPMAFDGGRGYHDHNWGFWEGVSWQWGQVQQGDLSFLYGRIFPPPTAADVARIPGLVGVVGPDGPLGFATNVTITETDDGRGQPVAIAIRARSAALDVDMAFDVESIVTTPAGGAVVSGLDFIQLRGTYRVTGRVGGRTLALTAPGSAETFRGRDARPR